jgi:GNAT superfamily N-acetyltransferase
MSNSTPAMPLTPIRFWQHWPAVEQITRDYPPGADVLVDRIRSSGPLARFAVVRLLAPLYFARQQGWAVRGPHGEIAAVMYLYRDARQGVRVLHIDNITVNGRFRRLGLAQHLLALAETLARAEQRPFLTLAVTTSNSAAVTLYRRLGFQEQHHAYFTFIPTFTLPSRARSLDIQQRRVSRYHTARLFQKFVQQEVAFSIPQMAKVLTAYYPQGVDLRGRHIQRTQAYLFEHERKLLGYGDGYSRQRQWQLRLSLLPELWGTPYEAEILQMVTRAMRPDPDSTGQWCCMFLVGPISLRCPLGHPL